MKKPIVTATSLRLILSISLFAVAGLGVVLFSFAYSSLKDVAVDVSHSIADADASRNNLQNLQKLQRDLVSKQEAVKRAESIVAESRSYEYQNQIINDLNDYATRAGIGITTIDFTNSQDGSTAPATPTAPAAPSTTVNGVKSTFVSITLKNPVDYAGVLRFLKSIEQNLTKMQVANVGLSKATDSDGVSTDALSIEVYIK